jgi:protein arginine N-methyltransferase 2
VFAPGPLEVTYQVPLQCLQTHSPAQHTIIEAHPDVIAHAKKLGWGSMPGVRLCEGRWQEVVPQLIQEGTKFDGIFFDTVSG